MQWKKLLWDKLHQAKHCTLTFLQLFQCRFAALQRVLCIVEIIVTYFITGLLSIGSYQTI